MFLTIKQAIQFLKTVNEDKVGQKDYLKDLIEQKRREIAKCGRYNSGPVSAGIKSMLIVSEHSEEKDISFNMMGNPMEKDQSLVNIGRYGAMSGEL